MRIYRLLFISLTGLLCSGCSSFLSSDLPEESPALVDMEEPLELFEEPDDEESRQALEKGAFTGLYVERADTTIEAMIDDEDNAVSVDRIVENSPGDLAGVAVGDLLLEAQVEDDEPIALTWPSQWRALELEAKPGQRINLLLDRAGREVEVSLTCVPRKRAPDRHTIERFTEDQKVGLVMRTATEFEARQVGLSPGGGAVVVGLSKLSPWRRAGLLFEDVLVAIDGAKIDHPQVVLDTIREKDSGDNVQLELFRQGQKLELEAPLSQRESEVSSFNIPVLFDYESDRGHTDTSFLLGLLGYESTPAAWEFTFLWFIKFRGGDADTLEEVSP